MSGIDYCQMLNNGLTLSYSTSPYYEPCWFPKGIAAGTIDVAKIKQFDCGNIYCLGIFQGLAAMTQVEQYKDCTYTDTATSKKYTMLETARLCVGATTSAPPSGISATPAPSVNVAPWTLPPTGVNPNPGLSTSNQTGGDGGSNTTTIIIICAAVVVALLVGGFVFVQMKKKKSAASQMSSHPPTTHDFVDMESGLPPTINSSMKPHQTKGSTRTGTTGTSSTGVSSTGSMDFQSFKSTGQLDMCDLDMYRLPYNDVRTIKPLAQGAYGEVLLGECMGKMIAIKRLLPSKCNMTDLQKFIWEIKLLSKIECPYVVHFIGVAWTKPSDIMLVTEFMEGGDLRNALEASKCGKTKFTWTQKLNCASNIAEGLVYLHLMDPKVIHRDLKSRNVLLDLDMNAKITDFGIARETDDATMTAGIGTYRWIAPEVLMDGHYTESADIFSFGVIMSELSTEIVPYSDLRNASGNPFTDTAIMAKVMSGELLPSFAPDCPPWFTSLAQECMALDPTLRPSAVRVAYLIRENLQGFV